MSRLLLAVSACALLAAPASASGAVTIGSSLVSTANGSACTGIGAQSCTLGNATLDPGSQASGGLVAGTTGVVVRWRIKTDATGAGFNVLPRVIAANTGVTTGESRAVPAAPGTYTFDTRMTIHAGEAIAVNVDGGNLGLPITHSVALPSSPVNLWNPPLGDGQTRSPVAATGQNELLVNADVEPDSDNDGFGDESQDACPSNGLTQGVCPQAPTGGGGSGGGSPGGGGGSGGGSGAGGGSGGGAGGTLLTAVPTAGIIAAKPPIATPKTAKKKKTSCRKIKNKRAKKRCLKKQKKAKRKRR